MFSFLLFVKITLKYSNMLNKYLTMLKIIDVLLILYEIVGNVKK